MGEIVEQITGMIMAVNLALHLQRNIRPTLHQDSRLTVNDTGAIVRRESCARRRVTARTGLVDDQCLLHRRIGLERD